MKRIVALLAGILLMSSTSAFATAILPSLTLTSGASTVTIIDGGAGDIATDAGVVGFVGTVGTWTLNVTTGVTSSYAPTMHLGSVDVGSGTITIKFSDYLDAAWFGTGATSAVGGVLDTGASGSFSTVINGTTVSSMNFGDGPFSGQQTYLYQPGEGDIIDLIAELTHTRPGASSFDFNVTPVPEPGTLLLLGAGFLGLAVYGKRRRNA